MLRFHFRLLTGVAAVLPAAAIGQTPAGTASPQPSTSAQSGVQRSYTAADFATFAPKTAYDMLVQVPSFVIISASSERGLGQASENVLINGQRIANKSGGAIEELQRISAANVERIDIADAASLGISGLSGAVANVIVKAAAASSGQFEWKPDFRAHYSKPNLFRGSASYSGKRGSVDYTFSIKDQAGRGAYGGPVLIYDPLGTLIERRHEVYHSESDLVTMAGKFALDGPGSSVGNLTLSYTPYWNPVHIRDRRIRLDGDHRRRTNVGKLDGWYYDVNADYEFALGPGRLKLIGVRHFDHEPIVTTQITSFDSGAADDGIRFSRNSRIGETIGRAEYGWKGGKNDWRVTVERAYNSLDQRGTLFELSPEGEFEKVDFPQGTGHVVETRYEAIGTWSRALRPNLDLQVALGAETSTLDRLDDDDKARKFFRPKGNLVLSWRPAKGWDLSLKLRRKVGQISFYDFLAQPKLSDDRENAGNPDLVPPQSWEIETEIRRDFGAWGNTRLKLLYYRIEDIIDVIPIGDKDEGIGNLPRATQLGLENTSTIQLAPLGWKGAKLDLSFGVAITSVRDPLTGDKRAISGTRDRWASVDLRHDIPGSQIAWGVSASHDHYAKNYFLTEVYRSWEGPWWFYMFVEHKDVMGMTVRVGVDNIFNARHRWTRFVYEDWRDAAPISFIQRNNQLIGPIFSATVKGTF